MNPLSKWENKIASLFPFFIFFHFFILFIHFLSLVNYAFTASTRNVNTRYCHICWFNVFIILTFLLLLFFNCLNITLSSDFFFFFFLKQQAACSSVMHSRSQSLPLPAVHRQSNKTGNTLTQLRCRSYFCWTSVQYESPYYTLNTNFLVILSTSPLCIFIYIDMTQLGYAVVEPCIIFNDIKCTKNHTNIRKMSAWSNTISNKKQLREEINIRK